LSIDEEKERTSESEVDWDSYVYYDEAKARQTVKLDRRDYVALFLAALQTVMLPVVLLIVILFVIGLYLGIFL
jgi:hypothetical protein